MLLASRPVPALRQLIRHYHQVTDSLLGRVALQPVPARSPQILEFMFGTRYQVRRPHREAPENVRAVALVGSRTNPSVELILSGNVDAFTIVFLPGAFSTLFGIPAVELTNGDFDGEDVLGRHINELYARLGEVSAFHDRVHIADSFLTTIRPDRESVSAIIRTAQAMIRNNGSVRVSELAHRTDLDFDSSNGASVRKSASRPNCLRASFDSRQHCSAAQSNRPPDGPILRMTWAITIKCTWCTISRDCPGTVRTRSPVNWICLSSRKCCQADQYPRGKWRRNRNGHRIRARLPVTHFQPMGRPPIGLPASDLIGLNNSQL